MGYFGRTDDAFGSTDPSKQGGNMKLTLIRGIPGSGKSTRAEEIQDGNTVIVEADDFWMDEDGQYKFNPKFLPEAHKLCQAETAYFLYKGINVIVSNTNINFSDIKVYWDIAERFGAEFEIINCEGNYGSIHAVPEKTMRKMSLKFAVITTEEWIKHANQNYKD